MMMKRFVVLNLLAAFFLLPSVVHSQSDEALEKEIMAEIQRRHRRDNPEWWKARAPRAPIVAMKLFEKVKSTRYKMALIQALSWFDTPEVEAFLKEQALNNPKRVLQDAAVKTIANSQGIKAKDFVKDFLTAEHPQTRFVAAQALSRMSFENEDEDLKKTIAQYRANEKEDWIIAKLDGQKVPKETGKKKDLFAGEWEGYWIRPKGKKPGLDSFPAKMKIEKSGAGKTIKVEYGVMKKDKFEKLAEFALQDLRFQKTGFKGRVSPGATSPEIFNRSSHSGPINASDRGQYAAPVDAELIRASSGPQIRMSIPKWEAFLLVRRRS